MILMWWRATRAREQSRQLRRVARDHSKHGVTFADNIRLCKSVAA